MQLNNVKDSRLSKINDLKFFNGIELKQLTVNLERIDYKLNQTRAKNKYGCEICSETFTGSSDLRQHLSTHPRKGSYSCRECSIKTTVRDVFLHHVRSVHTELWPFNCSQCPRKFTVESYRDLHQSKIHLISVSCEYCFKPFQFKENLEKHMEIFHKCDKPFKCQKCSMKFPTRYRLNAHKITHDESRAHKCTKCGKGFKNSGVLHKHMTIHPESVFQDCGQCSKKFVSDYLLQRHIKAYHPGIAFASNAIVPFDVATNEGQSTITEDLPCYECNFYFKCRKDLSDHVGSHYRKGYYPCGICPKKFTLLGRIKTHLMMHSNERGFVCEICDKKFYLLGHLKSHLLTHTGERPYVCSICSKQFPNPRHLKSHELTHINDGSYPCPLCPRKFKRRRDLVKHKKNHEQNFVCKFCSSYFMHQNAHQEHEALHTRNTGFACNGCPKRFKFKSMLKTHSVNHTGTSLFTCDVCGRRLKDKYTLLKHEKLHLKRKKFSCDQCPEEFDLKGLLEMHMHEAHIEKNCEIVQQIENIIKQEIETDHTWSVTEQISQVNPNLENTSLSAKTLISYEEIIKIEPL